jgi:hypothetical protein
MSTKRGLDRFRIKQTKAAGCLSFNQLLTLAILMVRVWIIILAQEQKRLFSCLFLGDRVPADQAL